jgi:hypothetical protein
MPKYLIINNNVVSNTIEAPDLALATTLNPGAQLVLEATPLLNNIGIGFVYTGTGLVPFIIPSQTGGPPTVNTPWTWFIDVGPFFDRFGAFKLPILINSDPGIKGLITDLQVRKWVDLQNNEVAAGLAYISTIIPAFTSDIRLQILTTPVTSEENRALRKLYFS